MEKTQTKDLAAAFHKDDEKGKLSPKQLAVISLMVAGISATAAAEKEGVSGATIRAWFKNGKFNDEYRLAMERQRSILENQIIRNGQKGNVVISKLMDDKNPSVQLEASKIAVNAAVRSISRYKELQVQGFIAPVAPLVVFPEGTNMPWASKQQALPEGEEDVIDGELVGGGDDVDGDE